MPVKQKLGALCAFKPVVLSTQTLCDAVLYRANPGLEPTISHIRVSATTVEFLCCVLWHVSAHSPPVRCPECPPPPVLVVPILLAVAVAPKWWVADVRSGVIAVLGEGIWASGGARV